MNAHGQDWHVEGTTLARYAAGEISLVTAASTETHLTGCSACRARLAPAADPGRLAAIWSEVDHRVEVSSLPVAERMMRVVGVRDDTARLLAAAPSLTASWLLSIAVAVAFAVAAADTAATGLLVFLVLAPMLPVAGVAAAYGRSADPAYELAVAAPYSLLRLLLVRSVAVVGSTLALTAVGSLVLFDAGWTAVAWLLPALALSTSTLALSPRVAPVWAASGVLTAWVAVVGLAWRSTGDRLAAFGDTGQLAAAGLIVLAAAVLMRTSRTLGYDTRRSA